MQHVCKTRLGDYLYHFIVVFDLGALIVGAGGLDADVEVAPLDFAVAVGRHEEVCHALPAALGESPSPRKPSPRNALPSSSHPASSVSHAAVHCPPRARV